MSAEAQPLHHETTPMLRPTAVRRRRLLLLVLLACIAVLGAWLVLGRGDGAEQQPANGSPATVVSLQQLSAIAAGVGHPLYWAGAVSGSSYELTRLQDGRTYIRYLPVGTEAGSPRGEYLTVGTYPQERALDVLRATAKRQGVSTVSLAGGGLAFQDAKRPTSVYAAYPGVDLQVEVFDPSAGQALSIVKQGQLAPLAKPASSIASVAQLEALEADLGHPVYWAGAEAKGSYELTRTSDGRVYVRYLAAGAAAGTSDSRYLTVGTYPQEDALATLKATAAKAGGPTIPVPGGGVGYVDAARPTSAYVAYPGIDLQVELYAPDPQTTRELMTSGGITPIG